MKFISVNILVLVMLTACGGGGGSSAPGSVGSTAPTIKAADYTLPTAIPSVPDQAAKSQ
jgi:hypothetical protein